MAVRRIDRPHHLHRGDIRPDGIRPLGRSWVQARPMSSRSKSSDARQLGHGWRGFVEQVKRVARRRCGRSDGYWRRIPTTTAIGGIIPPGSRTQINIGQYNVGEGFFDAMGLKLKAGRWFDANRPMDDMTLPYPEDKGRLKKQPRSGASTSCSTGYAVKKLGFKSPRDAVGQTVKSEIIGEEFGMVNINIIGVVCNSRFRSVRTSRSTQSSFAKSGPPVRRGEGVRYRGDPQTVRDALRAAMEVVHQRGALQRQVQRRRYRRRRTRSGGRAGANLPPPSRFSR